MPDAAIKKAFNKFLQQTIGISILLLLAYFALIYFGTAIQTSPATIWLVLFFLLVSNYVYYQQLKASTGRQAKFVNVALLSTGFKLLLFLAIIVVYAVLNREDAVPFIMTFFILYLIFTVLEVFHIKAFQNKSDKFKVN
jgi:L-asparagine transporter-like permease